MNVATLVATVFDNQLPFRVEAYDGSIAPPSVDSTANTLTLKILNREALTRFVTHPGELGLARAYVAGDVDVDGDLDLLFEISPPPLRQALTPDVVTSLLATVGVKGIKPLAPPSIEARPRGLLHSRARDRQAVTHHYDVSNRFYEMVLGPSMTYSCAVFATPEDTLEQAQSRKVDLVARKLDLHPGDRLLDIGCGWGTMAINAAQRYGARVLASRCRNLSSATPPSELAGRAWTISSSFESRTFATSPTRPSTRSAPLAWPSTSVEDRYRATPRSSGICSLPAVDFSITRLLDPSPLTTTRGPRTPRS